MRASRLLTQILPLAALIATSAACAGDDEKQVMPPVVVGMLESSAPTYDDGETQIYEVHKEVRLPFRAIRDDSERPQGAAPPYRRPPFHLASESRITVRFTLSNLDDRQHTVWLLVDPWNEFVRYVPGVNVSDEETVPNLSGIDKPFILPPKGRVEGIITPDDMVELATDLTTAMRLAEAPPPDDSQFAGPTLYNRAFNIQNRSSEPDPVLAPFMPLSPLAAIIGFDLGLRTYEQAKLALEIVTDIDDLNGDRVIEEGDDARMVNRPGDELTPPAAPMR